MKKLFFCGLLMTSLFSIGQTNVTDVETMISYHTSLIQDNRGNQGFVLNDNIIETPQEIYDAVAGKAIQWPIEVNNGPRTYSTVTLPNGQQAEGKFCWNTTQSWCMIKWIGF